MTQRKRPGPVSEGDFGDGADIMLWNPNLTPALWRRAQLRALSPTTAVLYGLTGLASVGMGLGPAAGTPGVLLVVLGSIVVGIGVGDAVINLACFATDHRHRRGGPCRMDQRPGEFFYRSRDFSALGAPASQHATQLITAVAELAATPARSWLGAGLLSEVHRVVWDALCCLDRTRSARALATQLAAEPGESELAASAAEALARTDHAVTELVSHLRGCLIATRAWEAKLRHRDLAACTDTALRALRDLPIDGTAAAAETLLQRVHAYLTAARDLTGTGPFPWETGRHPTAQRQHNPDQTRPVLLARPGPIQPS